MHFYYVVEAMKVYNVDVSVDEKYQKNLTSYYGVKIDVEWVK